MTDNFWQLTEFGSPLSVPDIVKPCSVILHNSQEDLNVWISFKGYVHSLIPYEDAVHYLNYILKRARGGIKQYVPVILNNVER